MPPDSGSPLPQQSQRPWRWALLWGALLGVLFFGSYTAANHFTAQRSDVSVYVFAWERHIPFLAWTILPYWSIDFLYAAALFAARSKAELFRLAYRLLAAQIICITGFLLWPLRFSFTRPATDGWTGAMFDALTGFDLPFNQAPSLHICLLVVLWRFYADLTGQKPIRWLLHTWFALIGISVLTTWQHHFIDLVTGLSAGALCLLLVPEANASWRWRGHEAGGKRLRLGLIYLAGATLVASLGAALFPAASAWPFYWLAASLAGVGAIYLGGEATHFGKQGTRMPWRSWMFFGPHLAAARLNVWLWTRKLPIGVEVHDGVFLGRQPDAATQAQHDIHHVVDLCAELSLPASPRAASSLPVMDLIPLSPAQLTSAAQAIEEARQQGLGVWVCCALGFSRSAACVAAWLVQHRGFTPEEALAAIRRVRPQVVLKTEQFHDLTRLA
ncbi:phosphatase PAP2/dual specificity phosphatase family protein [Uliginosibacterium flavum]|uniref:Phosphatase PAP2/dual specificity phosphatase family protein n=1 Tax=Uliginosibacterium flavum TaxID=1396831 RepID=A0ABV2TQC8_9RHOO